MGTAFEAQTRPVRPRQAGGHVVDRPRRPCHLLGVPDAARPATTPRLLAGLLLCTFACVGAARGHAQDVPTQSQAVAEPDRVITPESAGSPADPHARACQAYAPSGTQCDAMADVEQNARYALCTCVRETAAFHAVIDMETGEPLRGDASFPLREEPSNCYRPVPSIRELDGTAPPELIVRGAGGCGSNSYGDQLWIYELLPRGPRLRLGLTVAELADRQAPGSAPRVVYSAVDSNYQRLPTRVLLVEHPRGTRLEITRHPALVYLDEVPLAHTVELLTCELGGSEPRCSRSVEPVRITEDMLSTGHWYLDILLFDGLLQHEDALRRRGFWLPAPLSARMRSRVDARLSAARGALQRKHAPGAVLRP